VRILAWETREAACDCSVKAPGGSGLPLPCVRNDAARAAACLRSEASGGSG